MGQIEKWQKIVPITMNLDETKWDRIPPMSRTFLGGPGDVGCQNDLNWVMWGVWGVPPPTRKLKTG